MDSLPEDVFVKVQRWPERDMPSRVCVKFTLFREGSAPMDQIFFWMHEWRKDSGLSKLELLEKYPKLLRSAKELR